MKVCACVLLFTILANVGRSAADSPPLNDRAVHLALETVLEFNDKDKESDLKFLDKVKSLINKVKTVIDKSGSYRREFKDGDIETLTDFIQQAVSILNSYDDVTFDDFFKTLDDEVRKYHYRGCKFHELMENFEIRSLLGTAFDLIKAKPVQVIKAYMTVLADTLKDESYDSNVKEIINYINSLYGTESKNKLTKFLQEIDNYGKGTSEKKHSTLVRILRDGIRSIVFDHYTELNPNARRELKAKIEMYLKKCKESPSNLTSNNVKSETIPKKSLRHGVYKKETIKLSEKKLARIDINPRDFKKKSVERFSGDEKKGTRHHRKEKKRQLKFPAIPVPTVKEEDKELRAESQDEELSSLSSSSEEDDEGTDETVERNSIDISPERKKAYNTMRYITLYPEAITNVPRNNDKDTNVVHRSGRATTPRQHRFLTMWVEESTGGIPQYILNKYKATTLKPRKQKHKKANTKKEKKHKKKHTKTKDKYHNTDEGRESTKKKHGQKYKTHHNTRYTKKYVTKHTTTYKPSREHHYTSKKHKSKPSYEKLKHSNSKKIHKLQEIKEVPPGLSTKKINNIFGPVRLDVNRNLLLNKITARTTSASSRRPPILRTTPSSLNSVIEKTTDEIQQLNESLSPSNSTITPDVGLSIPASLSLIAERFNILNRPLKWDMRRNAEHHPRSDEGLSIENFDKKKQASSSKEDPFLMKRLHRLEKELKEVKNRINTATKRTKKRELGKRSKENIERADKHRENDPDSYDIRSVEHDRRKHHKTTELTTTRKNIRNEQPKHASTVKKPEYQIEYKIVKEKGSGFKEIILNHRSKVSDKIIPIENHEKEVKTPSDERQAKSHNNSILIEFSTKLFPIMTTKKSTTTVRTTEVDSTTATHFTGKALRDVTTTNNHDIKTTTVASVTSVATVSTDKTTIVQSKFKSIDIVPSDFTVPDKHVAADLNVKVTTKTVKQQTNENRGKDAIVMFKGVIEKSGKSVAQNEV
ncbi:uncharacterized protein LOC111363066 [Spodoptera litura]|uniref:Uncharacterized protein LOC111363066 n=1 Tax=Spodoptera litura TaxID=69820 RepID=A0A9J7EUM9_SPOLT|nr:uncharacterized protein LOC111363066 [Spodoptera litura]